MTEKLPPSRTSIPLGRYRHYKGREYRVIGIAIHSESGEHLVVYRCLYGDFGLWVRPLTMFQEVVEIAGESIPRFAFLYAEADTLDKEENDLDETQEF